MARGAHDSRQLYTVLIGNSKRPECFIELKGSYVGVGFLDDNIREYLSYQFQEVEPGRLFLTMATHRKFQGTSDATAIGTTYIFNRDGTVDVEDREFLSGKSSNRQLQADVSRNWEHYPIFGDYLSLVKIERS